MAVTGFQTMDKTKKLMISLPILQGFFLGASMIMAIGAQNAWVIKQGIARSHHLLVATVCVLCDVVLIVLGVYGAATLLSEHQLLMTAITIAGAAFLGWYGALSLKSALQPVGSMALEAGQQQPLMKTLMATLALTLLNPHVYLDTVVVLGSVGAQFEGGERLAFTVGTVMASVVWFYGLAVGAAKLAPILSRPRVRRGIDLFICVVMWAIAGSLVNQLL